MLVPAPRLHDGRVIGVPDPRAALHLGDDVVQQHRGAGHQAAPAQLLHQHHEIVAHRGAGQFGVRGFGGPYDVDEELLLAAPAAVDGGLADARGTGDALDGQLRERHAVLQQLQDALRDGPLHGLAAGAAPGGAVVPGVAVGEAHWVSVLSVGCADSPSRTTPVRTKRARRVRRSTSGRPTPPPSTPVPAGPPEVPSACRGGTAPRPPRRAPRRPLPTAP